MPFSKTDTADGVEGIKARRELIKHAPCRQCASYSTPQTAERRVNLSGEIISSKRNSIRTTPAQPGAIQRKFKTTFYFPADIRIFSVGMKIYFHVARKLIHQFVRVRSIPFCRVRVRLPVRKVAKCPLVSGGHGNV